MTVWMVMGSVVVIWMNIILVSGLTKLENYIDRVLLHMNLNNVDTTACRYL